VSADFLMKLSYCLLVAGIAGLAAAAVLYRKLELSRAWHILFAVPLPSRQVKAVESKAIRSKTAKSKLKSKGTEIKTGEVKATEPLATTQRLISEDTVVLYEETMIHTTEVI